MPNWVATVALNLSRSGRRRAKAERRANDRLDVATPRSVAAPDGTRVDLFAALAALPRRQREVAVLRYLLGLSTRETAQVLAVSEGTVKNSLSHARDALAVALRADPVEADDADA